MASIWDNPTSHGDILKKVWKHLDLGTLQRKHPFHLPVLATSNSGSPETRIVVLRRFWRRPPKLAFHTHRGSPKVEQIEKDSLVSWLFYHPDEKFQVRVRGVAKIHVDDELAEEQWAATGVFSRRCYVGEAPSQESRKATSGLPEELQTREPTIEESAEGRKNFAVVSSTIESIDCLELDFHGHRRTLFTWNGNGELKRQWLTP